MSFNRFYLLTMLILGSLLAACVPPPIPTTTSTTQPDVSQSAELTLKGRAFEYKVGEYHLRITFLEEEQLRWEYLAAPDGLTGKTSVEELERSDIRSDIALLRWTEADGTQVVDVLDVGGMTMYANFVTADGQRFRAEAELVEVKTAP